MPTAQAGCLVEIFLELPKHLNWPQSPSISIGNLASHREIEKKVGEKLSLLRWRCNLWIDGCKPWDEHAWIGKSLKIGDVTLKIEEEIVRCLATAANPISGERDVDTLGT